MVYFWHKIRSGFEHESLCMIDDNEKGQSSRRRTVDLPSSALGVWDRSLS